MRRVRRQLSRLAAGWLVLQLAVVAPMPVALCAGLAADAAGAECTCSHGPGVACPMHHAASGRDSTSCSCRGTTDDTSLLASLFDTAALHGGVIDRTELDRRQRPDVGERHRRPARRTSAPRVVPAAS